MRIHRAPLQVHWHAPLLQIHYIYMHLQIQVWLRIVIVKLRREGQIFGVSFKVISTCEYIEKHMVFIAHYLGARKFFFLILIT